METKNNNKVTANSPPSTPRQKNMDPGTPANQPRRKPNNNNNNGFRRDVTQKLFSPPLNRGVPLKKLKQNQPQQPLKSVARTAVSEKDQRGSTSSQIVLATHAPTIKPLLHQDVGKQVWGGDEFNLLSLEHKAAEELYKRPKSDEINEALTVNVLRIFERLKELSKNSSDEMPDTIINEGVEIADSVCILKINGTSSKSVEMAGQKAQRAAILMLQAQMMSDKAKELLALSKDILQNESI